jgi:hypothetical protein
MVFVKWKNSNMTRHLASPNPFSGEAENKSHAPKSRPGVPTAQPQLATTRHSYIYAGAALLRPTPSPFPLIPPIRHPLPSLPQHPRHPLSPPPPPLSLPPLSLNPSLANPLTKQPQRRVYSSSESSLLLPPPSLSATLIISRRRLPLPLSSALDP